MISIKIISTPAAITRLRERGPQIIEALVMKMNELMIRLQHKVVGEALPAFFKLSPNIASTVQFTPARLENGKIVGTVQAGGPKTTKITLKSGAEVDYAAVQEYGVPTGWEILPFNKKALAFVLDGKSLIRRRVWHPPLEARPFMRSSLEAMTPEITEGLKSAFLEALNG
jgi:hypothetical protein